jgi:hypothetical protein
MLELLALGWITSLGFFLEKCPGILFEPLPTGAAAEVIGFSLEVRIELALFGIDGHSTDRVLYCRFDSGSGLLMRHLVSSFHSRL